MSGNGVGWRLRPFEPGDEAELVALFAQVFGRAPDPGMWRWKLKGRRSPVENVWVAARDDDGRPVAQYAGIPVRIRLAGSERWAMQSVDTMVAPAFRRRGILTALGTAAYACWGRGGVDAVFGIPNQNWGSRTDALGLQPLFPIAWRRVPLHAGAALARAAGVRGPLAAPLVLGGDALAGAWRAAFTGRAAPGGKVCVERVTLAGDAFDALWRRVAPSVDNGLVRDASWVEWRYLRAPDPYTVLLAREGGEPAGYVAYRLAGGGPRPVGVVADLVAPPQARHVARALAGAALADLLGRGAESAQAAAARGSALDRTLRGSGFIARRGSSLLVLASLTPSLDPGALRGADRWLLSAGDFDVV